MAKKTTTKKHSAVPPTMTPAAKAPTETAAAVKPVTTTAATATPAPVQATATKVAETKATPAKTPAAAAATLAKLSADLQSDSAATRATAATEIGRSGDKLGAKALIAALGDSDADVAREAAGALGVLGDPSAVAPLIDVLNNDNGYFHSVVRAAAASSLAQLKDARGVDALIFAVRDPIAEASAEAVRALATLADPRAISPLIEVVRNESGFYMQIVRRAAVLALGKLGGEQATAELRTVAANSWEDTVVREAAQHAIEHGCKNGCGH